MNTFFFFGQENEIFIYNLGLQQVVRFKTQKVTSFMVSRLD